MSDKYKVLQSEASPDRGKEAKRRKVSPEDVQALQRRAETWGNSGGLGRAGVKARAALAFGLYLDFLRVGILGADFPRWLSRHSGIDRATCWRYLKAGEAQDVNRERGRGANRNQSGLVAEQMERQRTTGPELDWQED